MMTPTPLGSGAGLGLAVWHNVWAQARRDDLGRGDDESAVVIVRLLTADDGAPEGKISQ